MQKADWTKFSNLLDVEEHFNHLDLDRHEEHVITTFRDAVNASIPLTTRPKRIYKNQWFQDDRVAEASRLINRARKLYRRQLTPTNRYNLTDIGNYATTIKAQVREEKWVGWCRKIDSQTSLKKIWSNINKVKARNPAPAPHPYPGEANRLVAGHAALLSLFNASLTARRLPS